MTVTHYYNCWNKRPSIPYPHNMISTRKAIFLKPNDHYHLSFHHPSQPTASRASASLGSARPVHRLTRSRCAWLDQGAPLPPPPLLLLPAILATRGEATRAPNAPEATPRSRRGSSCGCGCGSPPSEYGGESWEPSQ